MSFIRFSVHTEGIANLAHKLPSREKISNALAVEVARDTERFVPKLTGSMADRTQIVGSTIIYPGPYARYLYAGKVMVDSVTGKGPNRIVDENGDEFLRFRKGATLVPTGRDLSFNASMNAQAQAHWFEASKAQNLDKWKEFVKEMELSGFGK